MRATWTISLLAACSFPHGAATSGDAGRSGDAMETEMGSDAGSDAGIDSMPSTLRAKTITVTAPITGTLQDFPMWFTVTDADLKARMQLDGIDSFLGGVVGNGPDDFGTNMGLEAMLDEVRIIGIARGPEWIAAEALDQMTPASFYSVGNEEIP
jgi:hypothetical protein